MRSMATRHRSRSLTAARAPTFEHSDIRLWARDGLRQNPANSGRLSPASKSVRTNLTSASIGKQILSVGALLAFHGSSCRDLLGAYRQGAGVLAFLWCVEVGIPLRQRVQHPRGCGCSELRPRGSTSHHCHGAAVAWDVVLRLAHCAHHSYGIVSVSQLPATTRHSPPGSSSAAQRTFSAPAQHLQAGWNLHLAESACGTDAQTQAARSAFRHRMADCSRMRRSRMALHDAYCDQTMRSEDAQWDETLARGTCLCRRGPNNRMRGYGPAAYRQWSVPAGDFRF